MSPRHDHEHQSADSDITRLLHGAVDDIEPRRNIADLHPVLDDEPGRTTWVRGAVAAAAAVVLVTAGAAYVHHLSSSGSAVASERTVDATVYYAGRTGLGQRLFSEHHRLTGVTGTDIQAAVDAALGMPDDPDYTSSFAAGTTARASVDDSGEVVIDFPAPPQLIAGGDPGIAIQSLVWTVDGVLQRPAPVHFTVNGSTPVSLLGTPARASYSASPRDAVLSSVSLDLAEGARLNSGTTIRGMASAYEGDVVWTLRQGSTVVRRGFTTAEQCCTLAPFAFTLDAPAGNYTLSVSDTNASGGEGNAVTTDSKDVEIR